MRKTIGTLTLATAALFARADNTAVDYSDLWYNPAHDGWGLGIDRQADIMFVTLFIYADDGTATWLSASDVRPANAEATSWSGKLYRTTGSPFAAPFDASSTAIAEVGSLRIDFNSVKTATLTYVRDGKTVVEPIQRFSFRLPTMAGSYQGGMSVTASRCNDDALDGGLDIFGPVTVTQTQARVAISFTSVALAGLPSSCTFTGAYSPGGRLGAVQGNWRCNIVIGQDDRGENTRTVSRLGTFSLENVATTASGFAGKLVAHDQDCTFDGRLGAVRLP